jgi:hypothetical protein
MSKIALSGPRGSAAAGGAATMAAIPAIAAATLVTARQANGVLAIAAAPILN